jgi:hypothetical protein
MKQNKPKELSFIARGYGKIHVVTSTYRHGDGLAVELVKNGEPFAVLSVNIPEAAHRLGPNEFFVKTWSENAEIANDALASGIFRYTGRTSGDTLSAPIWQFT